MNKFQKFLKDITDLQQDKERIVDTKRKDNVIEFECSDGRLIKVERDVLIEMYDLMQALDRCRQ